MTKLSCHCVQKVVQYDDLFTGTMSPGAERKFKCHRRSSEKWEVGCDWSGENHVIWSLRHVNLTMFILCIEVGELRTVNIFTVFFLYMFIIYQIFLSNSNNSLNRTIWLIDRPLKRTTCSYQTRAGSNDHGRVHHTTSNTRSRASTLDVV